MSRRSFPVVLAEAELSRFEQWILAGSTLQQVVLRARIIFGAAIVQSDKGIVGELAILRKTVALWRRRAREYHWHGTTTLFAALQVAEGRVIGQC